MKTHLAMQSSGRGFLVLSLSAVAAGIGFWVGLAAAQERPVEPPGFRVKLDVVKQELSPQFCWFLPRTAAIPGAGRDGLPAVLLTLQKHLSVSDHYSGLCMMRTDDLGKTWTGPSEIPELGRVEGPGGVTVGVCDVVPGWHPQTGKVIAIGASVRYRKDGTRLADVRRFMETAYAVYDPKTDKWSRWQSLHMPDDDKFNLTCGGSCQWLVEPDGTLLLPIYFSKTPTPNSVTVLKCAFDGRKMTYLKHGSEMSLNVERGLSEPSLVKFNERYYLTIRGDLKGYVTASDDGLNYRPIQPWIFDDGSDLGNYNTQQHWLTHGQRLFLAYTRRGAQNNHISWSRAPIFLAQVDPGRLCVIRSTEKPIIPERGAMLGNFGAAAITPNESWVTDAEYMLSSQPSPRGANGSVFVARVIWSKPDEPAP
jgi:hypothetical protein